MNEIRWSMNIKINAVEKISDEELKLIKEEIEKNPGIEVISVKDVKEEISELFGITEDEIEVENINFNKEVLDA